MSPSADVSKAFSGGGATAVNIIGGKANAFIQDSTVTATGMGEGQGQVALSAVNSSEIDATVAAISVSAGAGTTPAVAIGFSLARNLIGWSEGGGKDPIEVRAYVDDTGDADATEIHAARGLTLTATASGSIDAVVEATAGALAASTGSAFAVAGAGLWTDNKMAAAVQAEIVGADLIDVDADGVSLIATNTSSIVADAQAVALTASLAGSTGGAVSIGLSLAHNTIDNDVAALIRDTGSVLTNGTGVSVTATDSASIHASSIAAAVSAGIGGSIGFAVSGGGAESTNVILTRTNASIKGSALGMAVENVGNVDIDASSTADIDALIGAVPGSVSFGGTTGVGVAIGIGVARNFIGWDPSGTTVEADYDSHDDPAELAAGTTVRIASGPMAGEVFEYLGPTLTDGDPNTDGIQTIDLSTQNYQDKSVWRHSSLGASPAEIQAKILDSSIQASGALTLDAAANETIDAIVVAGAVALSGGGSTGVGVSGSGVYSENQIGVDVKSYIDGDGAAGILADSVALTAQDTSTINALAGAASLASSLGGTAGVSVSIGVSLAGNTITSDVEASITGADGDPAVLTDDGVTATTAGGITLRATETATINAISAAASLAAGFGGIAGVAVSGAGAESTNIILTDVNAYVSDSALDSAGDVDLDASNAAAIHALVVSASYSATVGGTAGVGASIGAALATNLIGFTESGTRQGAEVQAYIQNSSVIDASALAINAISNLSVNAVVLAGSVAVAGGTVGVGLAGAGASSENCIAADVHAYIDGDGASGITVDSVSLNADEKSKICADTGAASVAASFGVAGASVSVGVAISSNMIDNQVEAYVKNADNLTTKFDDVSVTADETSAITAVTAAASAAASVSIGGAGAGAETTATNTLTSSVAAFIQDSDQVQSAGAVLVSASDTSTISADIASVALGAGLVSLAVGVTLADNTIGDSVSAYIDNAGVTAGGAGDIWVTASSNPTISTTNVVGAVAFGFGGAGAGGSSETTINGTTQAYVDGGSLTADGNRVVVSATSTALAAPVIRGLSGGLASVAVMTSNATIEGETRAYAGGDTTITANGLSVTAIDTARATPSTVVVGVGGVTEAGAKSVTRITRTTQAFIDEGADVSTATGAVDVSAQSTAFATGKTAGVAGGLSIAIAALVVDVSVAGDTRAYVGDGATVEAGRLNLAATANNTVTAPTTAIGVGLVGVSGVVLTASDDSTVEAYVGPHEGTASAGTATTVTITHGGVDVSATVISSVIAEVDAVSVSLLASGAGTSTTATASPTARAYLGDDAVIDADGDVVFDAVGQVRAVADGLGFSAAAGYSAAGASVTTTVNPTVRAFTVGGGAVSGDNVTFRSRLNVNDFGNPIAPSYDGSTVGPAYATVTLGSAALLGGAAGGVVNVTNSPTLEAAVGAGTVVNAGSKVTVESQSFQRAQIDALSFAAGAAVGMGVILPSAISSGSTSTYFNGDLQSAVDVEIRSDVEAGTQVLGRAGGGGGIAGITDTTIHAKTSPVVTTSAGGQLTAANDVTIESLVTTDAYAAAQAMSFGFGAVGWVKVYATVVTDVDTYVGEGAEIRAGRDVKVTSSSTTHVDAVADATTIGVAAASSLDADARITNSTHFYIGSHAKINAGHDFELLTDSFGWGHAKADAASGGAFAGGEADSRVILTNDTLAYLAPYSTVIATDTVTVTSQSELKADANTVLHSGAALAFGSGTSTIGINSNTIVAFQSNSTVEGDHVYVKAYVPHVDADALSETKTYALDSTAKATSNVDMNTDARVDVKEGASIEGRETLSITAWQDTEEDTEEDTERGSDLNSNAEAQVAGATGKARTEATGDIIANTDVNIDSGAELTSANVALIAHSAHRKEINSDATAYTVQRVVESIPLLGWLVKKITRALKVESTNENIGGETTDESTVTMNGVINLLSRAERTLHVHSDGTIDPTSDIAAAVDGDNVVVDPIINNSAGAVLIAATTDAGGGELRGAGTIELDRAYNEVNIQNDSDKDLRIGEINFWSDNAENPALSFVSSNEWDYQTSISTRNTPVLNISNTLGTDVYLDGDIRNVTGRVNIENAGGSILCPAGAHVYARDFNLSAAGTIGETTLPVKLSMQAGTLDANAGGDVYLEVGRQDDQNAVLTDSGYVLGNTALIRNVAAGGQVHVTLDEGTTTVEEAVSGTNDVELFSVGSEFQSDFENGVLSDPLRQEFEAHGIPVTDLNPQFSVTVRHSRFSMGRARIK